MEFGNENYWNNYTRTDFRDTIQELVQRVPLDVALEIANDYLDTPFEGRHLRGHGGFTINEHTPTVDRNPWGLPRLDERELLRRRRRNIRPMLWSRRGERTHNRRTGGYRPVPFAMRRARGRRLWVHHGEDRWGTPRYGTALRGRLRARDARRRRQSNQRSRGAGRGRRRSQGTYRPRAIDRGPRSYDWYLGG